jgi:hypothetical protein
MASPTPVTAAKVRVGPGTVEQGTVAAPGIIPAVMVPANADAGTAAAATKGRKRTAKNLARVDGAGTVAERVEAVAGDGTAGPQAAVDTAARPKLAANRGRARKNLLSIPGESR